MTKQQSKKPPAPKRGRGRPSKLETRLAESENMLEFAIEFIRGVGDGDFSSTDAEKWLQSRSITTAAEFRSEAEKETRAKREQLQREIDEKRIELAKLEGKTLTGDFRGYVGGEPGAEELPADEG